jgi:hypothetical protein
MARILFKLATHKLNRKKFIKEREKLDEGIGCVESYIESVTQTFIQTAFFAIANNLTITLSRLCYNQTSHACAKFEFQNCSQYFKCSRLGHDNNTCDQIEYFP